MTIALTAPRAAFATVPPLGETLRIAEEIGWIRMRLPFELNHVNLWRFEDADGVTLFDTGLGDPETRGAWRTALGAVRPKRVVVSHFHPDHMGNAGWFAEEAGSEILMTEREFLWANFARWLEPEREVGGRAAFYRRHGLDEGPRLEEVTRPRLYRRGVPVLPAAFTRLSDGDTITLAGSSWRVITTFGHAPEMTCLHCPERAILIAADEVLPRISPNIGVWSSEPEADPLAAFLASLDRLLGLPDDLLVLPSHGEPFFGLHERIGELKAHHAARCAELLDAAREPMSAIELMPVLFRRPLDRFQFDFAFGETLAHVNWLKARGDLVAIEASGRIKFRAAR